MCFSWLAFILRERDRNHLCVSKSKTDTRPWQHLWWGLFAGANILPNAGSTLKKYKGYCHRWLIFWLFSMINESVIWSINVRKRWKMMPSSGVLFCPHATVKKQQNASCRYNINVCLSHRQNVQITKVTAADHLKPTVVFWRISQPLVSSHSSTLLKIIHHSEHDACFYCLHWKAAFRAEQCALHHQHP